MIDISQLQNRLKLAEASTKIWVLGRPLVSGIVTFPLGRSCDALGLGAEQMAILGLSGELPVADPPQALQARFTRRRH